MLALLTQRLDALGGKKSFHINTPECRIPEVTRSIDLLIHVDIGGHPPIPTGSSCSFFIQHVFL
jgi:hypothetical protein